MFGERVEVGVGRRVVALGRTAEQAGRAPVFGERVEVGVGRRVVALGRTAEQAGRAGEQHEMTQFEVSRRLVQLPRTVHFGRQHAVQPVGVHTGQQPVVHHTRQVEHGAEPGQARHQGAHRRAVAQVAGGHGDPGREVLATPAGAVGEHEPAHAVPLNEVVGQHPPEGAGPAGDQHGPVRGERRGSGPRCLRRRESHGVRDTAAQRHRGFLGSRESGQERVIRRGVGHAEVDNQEPTGILGLGRGQQCSTGSSTRIRRLARQRHRATRDDHEPAVGVAVVGQPLLAVPQRRLDRPVHRRWSGIGLFRPGVHDHELGRRAARREQRNRLPDRCQRDLLGGRRRDRPQGQRVHHEHWLAVLVGGGEAHRVGPGRRHRHPQRVSTVAQQPHAPELERHPRRGRPLTDQRERVQCRVEQRRVQPESGRLAGDRLARHDLGVHDIAVPPCRPQALERRTVVETGVGQIGVELRHVNWFGPVGWAGGRRRHGRGSVAERPGSHQRPGIVGVGVVGPGVHGDGLLLADGHLQVHAGCCREWRLQREVDD